MYMNLKAEMARKGITNEQLAKAIDINPATMSAKLNIAGRMRLDEAQKLRDLFFQGMTMDYLFGDCSKDYQPTVPQSDNEHWGGERWAQVFNP